MLGVTAAQVIAVADHDAAAVVLLFVVLFGVAVARAITQPTKRRSGGRPDRRAPEPFSYWYALVPFEDTDGAKERPVLVLRQDGVRAEVLKVTSQAKQGRTNYRRIDTSRWDRPGSAKGSWVQTGKVVTIPLSNFRRHLGDETNRMFTGELVRIHPAVFR